MRVVVRSVGVAVLVIVATVLLALTSTMTSVFTLAAATYILKGTQFGVPFCVPVCGTTATDQQNIDLATPWITGTFGPPPGNLIVVNYPASFWPISTSYLSGPTYNQAVAQGVAALPPPDGPNGIQPGSVIFGYSQGSTVATIYKRNFNAAWASNPAGAPPITFVLIGNGSRPNGGAMERFAGLNVPILDFSFIGATPTQTAGAAPGTITTYDIARQYDGFADFPTNPLNLLADANALAGIALVHSGYGSVNMSQAVFQGTYGDTAYYLIPTYPLPLLMPLQMIPVVGPVLADTLDPALRVLVEAGYNRTINPGVPTPANFLYFPNPLTLTTNVLVAIPTGWDNGISDITGVRPFGTQWPLASNGYVVGGPPLTLPNQTPPDLPAPLTTTTTPVQNVAATNNTPPATQLATTQPTTPPSPNQTASKSVLKPIWPDMTSGNKVSPPSTSAGATSSSSSNPLTGALAGVTNGVTSAIGSLTGGSSNTTSTGSGTGGK